MASSQISKAVVPAFRRRLQRAAQFAVSAALLLGATELPASAQTNFPQKQVTIIVGFAPGGSTDIVARYLADSLSKFWKQPVVVENRAGAATMIAASAVVRAPADGYTLLFATSSVAIAKLTQAKPLADPLKDLAPIVLIANVPFMLVGSPSLPPKLKEVIDLSKAKAGTFRYGSSGIGASTHLVAELFRIETGADIGHVPYKSAPEALAAILSGNVHLTFDNPNSGLAQTKNGTVRAYAVTTPDRLTYAPDVPTLAELGFPGGTATSWAGLMAPAGTPRGIIERIRADVSEVLRAGLTAKIRDSGFEPAEIGPEGFEKILTDEVALWTRVTQAAGIKPE